MFKSKSGHIFQSESSGCKKLKSHPNPTLSKIVKSKSNVSEMFKSNPNPKPDLDLPAIARKFRIWTAYECYDKVYTLL